MVNMDINTAALASTIVTVFLIPFVKAGAEQIGKGVAEKASKETGEFVSGIAKKIWEKVHTAFSADEDQDLLEQLKKRPEKSHALVVEVLKEKLENDPKLAHDLAALIEEKDAAGETAGAWITQANIAGIADLRNADLRYSQNIRIAGVMISNTPSDDAGETDNN